MIAAERQQKSAAIEDRFRLPLDRRRRLLMIAVVEQAISIIDDGHFSEEIAVKRILRVVVEDRRRAADCLWPEARPRPVGCRSVKGNTPDDGVNALERFGETPTHERERAGKSRIAGRG